jgi:hypothetical protein
MAEELSQETEMILVYKQSRQPNCVYCNHALEEVRQDHYQVIVWPWDKILKQYMKSEEGSSQRPYHHCSECKDNCEALEWRFIDFQYIDF